MTKDDYFAVIEISPCYYKSKMSNLYKKDGADCRAIEFVGTENECQEHLIELACKKGIWYDDESHEIPKENDMDTSWYKGAGVYDGEDRLIYDPGIEIYHDDYRDFKLVSIAHEFGKILTDEGPEASGMFIKQALLFT